jgi:hypothetical protein
VAGNRRGVVETVLTMPTVKDKDQLVLLRVKIEATSIYCLLESGQSFEYRYTGLQRARELVRVKT